MDCHAKGDLLLKMLRDLEQRHGPSIALSFDGAAWDGSMSKRLLNSIERCSYAAVFNSDDFDLAYSDDLGRVCMRDRTGSLLLILDGKRRSGDSNTSQGNGFINLTLQAMAIRVGFGFTDPRFFTRGPEDHNPKVSVGSGITQGCPLNPYLFIIVLTVIMEDVDWQLAAQGVARNTWSVARPTTDIEYADDTLLIARTTTQLTSLLHTLEKHAELHGMHLNSDKTERLIDPKHVPPNCSSEVDKKSRSQHK